MTATAPEPAHHPVAPPPDSPLIVEVTIAEADLVNDIAAIVAMDNTVRRVLIARAAAEGINTAGCGANWVPLDRTAEDKPGEMRVWMWLVPDRG